MAPAVLDAVLEMLPVGVTVQDARGNFLLINETAFTQLDAAALAERQAIAGAVLDTAGTVETEETSAQNRQVLLTQHRPIRIGGDGLVLSTSVDISARKAYERELIRRAEYDDLTGLPKSAAVEARVAAAAHAGTARRFALAFFDIDNFKHINDYYGHAAGDALLVKVAQRLTAALDPDDLLARVSGDEFLLFFADVGDSTALPGRIGELSEKLRAPFFIDGFEVLASASIGVSIAPDHGDTFQALRRNADTAMYRAKNRAKGCFAIFDAEMEREAAERTALEQRLRLAILEKRFVCAFQPKVDIRTRKIHGVEALVRLCDENGIIQGPGTFVALAVELGLIDEMTHLVVEEIASSLDLIDDQFGADASISLNVAARQAGDIAFMRSLAEALQRTGCAQRFMIEVTEDAVVSKAQFQTEIVPLLRGIGARVSIDDFGTGFSSLSALADITADEVKIDRSFITDIHKRPRSQSVLRAIESLSASLGMTVIAEGVETFEELTYLQAATNIRYAQGFYFSRPLFVEDFAQASGRADPNRGIDLARPSHEDRHRLNRTPVLRR
ncbi:MAG: EAL domain-containing protein [Xanthobacteraceae bacterium]|nr:EAL domain-containing protein [Xanthobacteraceae bacterium]